MKVCNRCGVEKSHDEFPTRSDNGRPKAYCHPCYREYQREYHGEHKEEAREWREGYKPRARELWREFYHRNVEKRRQKNRDYYYANRDEILAELSITRSETKPWLAAYAKNPEPYKDAARERYLKKIGAFVEHVDRTTVYERDQGLCGICGLLVARDRWELDHRIPLNRDGLHSYENTRVSHDVCNGWKNDRLDEELPPIPQHILTKVSLQAAQAEAELAAA